MVDFRDVDDMGVELSREERDVRDVVWLLVS